MKIHELSRLTGVNPETIRMYRKKGFLFPGRAENGYYEYRMEDYISLIHLRKLRGFDLHLEGISKFYTTCDTEKVLDILTEKKRETQQQILLLQERLRFLELESRHVYESRETAKTSVMEIESVDEKIDFYEDFGMSTELVRTAFSKIYSQTTPCLFIPQRILNGEVKNESIPLRAGIGTYRYIMEENQLEVPERAVVIPHGRHLSQMIALEDHRTINILQLAPVMEWAREHGEHFVSGSTGYLCAIEHLNGRRIYHYRVRACVEKKSREGRSSLW